MAQAPPSGGRVDGRGEPIAGVSSFDERFGPRPEQAEDLGAVQEAVAAVEHELLLGVAPADERLGPRSASGEVEAARQQASITVQYASPAASGDSSPASIDTMASSSRASPSAISPR